MVESVSSSNIGAYSIGTYSSVSKTDTEVFENVFQDVLDAVGEDTERLCSQKIDSTKLGIPAGMFIEGI